MKNIVAIGAGQAGLSLCAKLRSEGFDGRITLIGAEPEAPYQRPPLSKSYLLGEVGKDRLLLRPMSFYTENDIKLRLNCVVDAVDSVAQTIDFSGRVENYDALVFTTGAKPRRLPNSIGGALAGVYTVRTIADINALARDLQTGRNLVIVGGGYIGLEAAAVATKKGLNVTVVEAQNRILSRVACQGTSDYFRTLHRSQGVAIVEDRPLERLQGREGHVTHATLSDGTNLPADLVIVGIGVDPEVDLAKRADVHVDNGIETDAFGRTNLENVWAAGDCASFPFQGRSIRLESVPNAIAMGENVAVNILGGSQKYVAAPWFWSDQYDVRLQIAGLNAGYDDVVSRRDQDRQSYWYYAGERLLAVDAMNDPKSFTVAKRLISEGKSPPKRDVSNANLDPKEFL